MRGRGSSGAARAESTPDGRQAIAQPHAELGQEWARSGEPYAVEVVDLARWGALEAIQAGRAQWTGGHECAPGARQEQQSNGHSSPRAASALIEAAECGRRGWRQAVGARRDRSRPLRRWRSGGWAAQPEPERPHKQRSGARLQLKFRRRRLAENLGRSCGFEAFRRSRAREAFCRGGTLRDDDAFGDSLGEFARR